MVPRGIAACASASGKAGGFRKRDACRSGFLKVKKRSPEVVRCRVSLRSEISCGNVRRPSPPRKGTSPSVELSSCRRAGSHETRVSRRARRSGRKRRIFRGRVKRIVEMRKHAPVEASWGGASGAARVTTRRVRGRAVARAARGAAGATARAETTACAMNAQADDMAREAWGRARETD